MNARCDLIRQLLTTAFNPVHLHIEDESWQHAGHAGAKEHGGGHFVVHIKSHEFNDIPRITRHRKVMQALKSLFPATIHALTIHAEGTD